MSIIKLTPIKNENFETYKWEETPILLNPQNILTASFVEEVGHVVIELVGNRQIIIDGSLRDLGTTFRNALSLA